MEVIIALSLIFLIAIGGLIYSIHKTLSAPVKPENNVSRHMERCAPASMQYCLSIQSKDPIQSDLLTSRKGQSTITLSKDTMIFGRDKNADIVLDDPRVSRMHFKIDQKENRFEIIDLNSNNGTFVNGQRLNYSCLLKNGDVISAGRFKAVFETNTIDQ